MRSPATTRTSKLRSIGVQIPHRHLQVEVGKQPDEQGQSPKFSYRHRRPRRRWRYLELRPALGAAGPLKGAVIDDAVTHGMCRVPCGVPAECLQAAKRAAAEGCGRHRRRYRIRAAVRGLDESVTCHTICSSCSAVVEYSITQTSRHVNIWIFRYPRFGRCLLFGEAFELRAAKRTFAKGTFRKVFAKTLEPEPTKPY